MELKFGTTGIREIMGDNKNNLNIKNIQRVSISISKIMIKKYGGKISALIGCDNRIQSEEFADVAARTFKSFGINVFRFKDIAPTPLVSYAIRKKGFNFGVMITASHNPKEYNGLKVYDHEGQQIMPDTTKLIQENMATWKKNLRVDLPREKYKFISKKITRMYINELISSTKVSNKKNATFAYSPLHGTGYKIVPKILHKKKFKFYEEKNQNFKSTNFIGTKSCNPEKIESYEGLIRLGKEKNVDAILVTDPDSDRVGVGVAYNGEFKLLSGNETAILVTNYLVNQNKIQKNTFIVYSCVSTDLPAFIAKKAGAKVFQTSTGFKWISNCIRKKETKELKFIYGYEESYGSLYTSDLGREKDAIQSVCLLTEIINHYKNKKKNILTVLDDVYKKYGYTKTNTRPITVPINFEINFEKVKKFFENLVGVSEVKDYSICKDELLRNKMLKVFFCDNSWIAVRKSGTEPIVKIYVHAQAKTFEQLSYRNRELNKIAINIKKYF